MVFLNELELLVRIKIIRYRQAKGIRETNLEDTLDKEERLSV